MKSLLLEIRIAILIIFVCICSVLDAGADSVVVVSPHPDDDILISAGIIYNAVKRGDDVKVVYMTNGDAWGLTTGYDRQVEAVNAHINNLQMVEDDLIFLGYPDGGLRTIFQNYTSVNSTFTSPNGQSQTYANRGLGGVDYHTFRFGTPGAYNRPNIIADLKDIFATFSPDHIYTTSEYDTHEDHYTSYDLVAMALNELSQEDPAFQTILHKTIVWSTTPELWPGIVNPRGYAESPDLSGTLLNWQERERIDVPWEMQQTDFLSNLKVQAVKSHQTQSGLWDFMLRFVHRDEIFWAENILSANQPPIAEAGPSMVVPQGLEVALDGSESVDPDGGALNYQWVQTGGIVVALSGENSATPMFFAPSGLTNDELLTFELVVSDGSFISSKDTTFVTVSVGAESNIAIQASVNASSENVTFEQFAVKAIDDVPDGWPGDFRREWSTSDEGAGAWIELTWNSQYVVDRIVLYDRPNTNDQITSGTLFFSDGSSSPVGVLQNDGTGTEISFTPRVITWVRFVVDNVSTLTTSSGLAEFEVFGRPYFGSNLNPVADAGTDQTVSEAASVSLNGTGSSDPDGDVLTYQWTQTAGSTVTLSDATAASPTFTAPSGLTQSEVLTFELVVSDGQLSSAPDSVNITVQSAINVNQEPAADAGTDQTVSETAPVSLNGTGSSDPDGDALTYQWTQTAGSTVTLSDATAASPTFTAPSGLTQSEVLTFELVVSDGQLSSAPDSVNVTVQSAINVNQEPVADAGTDQTVSEAASVSLNGTGSSDPDGDALTYQWTQTAGSTVTLSDATAASPTFTAPSGLTQSEVLTFELVVSDGQLSSAPDSVDIIVSILAAENIAGGASISASSENIGTGQFASNVADGVADGWPGDYQSEWASVSEGSGAWVELNWQQAYIVDRIVLYDRPNADDQILAGTLQFSDGSTVLFGTLENTGSAVQVPIAPRSVTSVRLIIDGVSANTQNVGLAEIEVYGY